MLKHDFFSIFMIFSFSKKEKEKEKKEKIIPDEFKIGTMEYAWFLGT